MNIYSFFNSRDVAEYCQSTGHTFNALECAALIKKSKKRSLKEKHAAYQTIIEEYPDTEIPADKDRTRVTSLHQALEIIIEYENQQHDGLLTPEPGSLYVASIRFDDFLFSSTNENILFETFEKAIEYVFDYLIKGIDSNDGTVFISKYLTGGKEGFTSIVMPSGEILYVCSGGPDTSENLNAWLESPQGEAFSLLSYRYFDVPVPFKRGDLVEIARTAWNDIDTGIYVLQDLCKDDSEQHAMLLQSGEGYDMTANVYHVGVGGHFNKRGDVESKIIRFYPDLQYCRRELQCSDRILEYVSLYMQEKISLCSLLKMQKILKMEENLRDQKEDPELKNELTEAGMSLPRFLPY